MALGRAPITMYWLWSCPDAAAALVHCASILHNKENDPSVQLKGRFLIQQAYYRDYSTGSMLKRVKPRSESKVAAINQETLAVFDDLTEGWTSL